MDYRYFGCQRAYPIMPNSTVAPKREVVSNMSQKEFDFFALCFKQLERKIDRLLEIAENAEHGCNDSTDSDEEFPDGTKDMAN